MSANGEPSVPAAPLPPPTFWDLCHWIAVRDSFLTGTVEGWLAAKEMVTLWGPQRLGMAAHPSLPALCEFVRERWGPRPPAALGKPGPGERWVALDAKACLDLRQLLCRDLQIRPAEADRMILSDVADHFCAHDIPIIPPSAGAETARGAVGGGDQVPSSAVPKRGKGKMIDERMIAELRDNPNSVNWSAKRWGERFKCAKSTIAGTKTWKETIRIMRMHERCDRRGGRSDEG